jgi:hypothetical protein
MDYDQAGAVKHRRSTHRGSGLARFSATSRQTSGFVAIFLRRSLPIIENDEKAADS